MNRYIFGIHDPPSDDWLQTYLMHGDEARGWIVFTEELGADPTNLSSRDYSHWEDMGFGTIARLNYGYYPNGTIPPEPLWQDFVLRVKNFVKGSSGCKRWIISNEMNKSDERPNGQLITAERYAALFSDVRVGIHEVRPLDFVIPGAIAPWNIESGDWLEYLEDMLHYCDLYGGFDAVCLHAYSHGSNPSQITDTTPMNPPYQDRYYNFQHYRQMIDRIPPECRGLPVYITETNENVPETGWLDEPNTWIQEMYAEINRWNQDNEPKIHCACLYCWEKRGDGQYIQDKSSVYQDLALAVAKAYTNEEIPPVSEEWNIVYENHCNAYHDQDGESEVTVPDGYYVTWVGVRPEMDYKYDSQPEVFPEDPPRSGVGFHVYNTFDWTLITDVPIAVAAGKRTKLEVALMVIAHGFDDDPTKLGDCGIQVGIGEPDDVQHWSDWYTVRDGPGGNLEEGKWVVVETPEILPMVGQVEVFIRCVANVPAAISAGHYDRIRIWQAGTVVPPQPPTGTYTVIVYGPNGSEVARCSFQAQGVNPQICSLAQQIESLSCGG